MVQVLLIGSKFPTEARASINVKPPGKVSLITICVARPGPLFPATMRKITWSPTVTDELSAVLLTKRSAVRVELPAITQLLNSLVLFPGSVAVAVTANPLLIVTGKTAEKL